MHELSPVSLTACTWSYPGWSLAFLAGAFSRGGLSASGLQVCRQFWSERPPGDVVIDLDSTGQRIFHKLLIDFTTSVPPLRSPSHLPVAQYPITDEVTKQHVVGENTKFSGTDRSTTTQALTGSSLIHTINQNQYLLYPWTIDQFGQFGPIPYLFLNGVPFPYSVDTAKHRSKTKLNEEGKLAFSHTLHPDAPLNILNHADAEWRTLHDDTPRSAWYTSTYHAQTPSHWATQVLSFNLTYALAAHYKNAFHSVTRHAQTLQPSHTPPRISCVKGDCMYPRNVTKLSRAGLSSVRTSPCW